MLLGEVRRTEALQLVATRALEVAEADLSLILLYDEASGSLTVEVAVGGDDNLVGQSVAVADSEFAGVLHGRHLSVVDDLGKAAQWPVPLSTGTSLLVPLSAAGVSLGALVVAYRKGSATFAEDPDVALVETFAGQAALALERARAQDEREMLAVVGDRERIARDLHDVVIQRLFAAGMQLQSVARLASRADVRDRIDKVVDDLDTTIRDIRGSIFELRVTPADSLRTEIRQLVDDARSTLAFRPELRIDGPIDTAVPEAQRTALLAVLREALTNVGKHARASTVRVVIAAGHGELRLTVQDDGVGMNQPNGSGNGLVNMQARAKDLGGGCAVKTDRGGGTVVTWHVPI